MHNGVAAFDLLRQGGEVQNVAARITDALNIAFGREINDTYIPAVGNELLANWLPDVARAAGDKHAHCR